MKVKRQHNKSCIYTGPVGARMRSPVYRQSTRVTRISISLFGGPLNGETLRVDTSAGATTLPFTLRGKTGRYVTGIWEPST